MSAGTRRSFIDRTQSGLKQVTRPASFARARKTALSAWAHKAHPLNSIAPWATILNDIVALRVGRALLDLHCFVAYGTAQKIDQRAFVVVQDISFSRCSARLEPRANRQSGTLQMAREIDADRLAKVRIPTSHKLRRGCG